MWLGERYRSCCYHNTCTIILVGGGVRSRCCKPFENSFVTNYLRHYRRFFSSAIIALKLGKRQVWSMHKKFVKCNNNEPCYFFSLKIMSGASSPSKKIIRCVRSPSVYPQCIARLAIVKPPGWVHSSSTPG
jgi:hypothetical protein